MKKDWKTRLVWLVSPAAIGIYITLITVYLSLNYYVVVNNSRLASEATGLNNLLLTAHQKSIDYRLRARGPRPVSNNVALLTVDERAVETIGRWPWPRDVLAKLIDSAVSQGAKVLAFDIVFSEPSVNPAETVLARAQADGSLSAETERLLKTYKDSLDADRTLGAVFAKHANHIVAGSFAEGTMSGTAPETEFCRDLIFKRSPAAKIWDKEEVLVSVTDPYQPYIPTAMMELFQAHLSAVEEEKRTELGAPRSKTQAVEFEAQVARSLHEACDSIFEHYRKDLNENWAAGVLAQENPKEFSFPTFDAWLEHYSESVRPNGLASAYGWNMNTSTVSEGVKHTGYFNTEQDQDGTIRSKSMISRTGNTYFPSIGLKAFLVANGFNASPRLAFSAATGVKEVETLEITNNETGDVEFNVPVDAQGRLLLNYAGPDRMFPYMSFADLLDGSDEATITQRQLDPATGRWELAEFKVKKAEFLKDKIFVVGATAIGIFDLRVTPFEKNYPGAETHLNVIDNLIQKNFFRTLPDEQVYMPVILGLIGLILSLALAHSGAIWGMGLTLLVLAGTGAIDRYYLFNNGIVVSIIWLLFLVSLLYVSLTFYRYVTEERGKKELRKTFQKYVSPAIVEEILSDPKNIELGGKKVHLTVMFSDVRGFTTISEKLDPRALSDLLNSYLTPMTELVFKNQGTLDKYMGDAIMAFFGAPITYKEHAKCAARCALQSVEKLRELQADWEKKGLPSIDLGIGLNTGDVSVGNMGSETVRSYTVMGDAVNLASRLEGINKTYGTRIIISEFTYNEIKDSFICREVDWVRVKGKILPVKIYELMAEEKVPAPTAELLKWFQDGYLSYHERKWQPALEAFSKALNLNPSDEVSKLYIQRCQDYILTPPEDGWDGVFVMKTK